MKTNREKKQFAKKKAREKRVREERLLTLSQVQYKKKRKQRMKELDVKLKELNKLEKEALRNDSKNI